MSASWVVVDKKTGVGVLEFYGKVFPKLKDPDRYKIVPILEYLQSINRKGA